MAQEFNLKTMDVCDAEYVAKSGDVEHPLPHQHDHYEMYFLHNGKRDVFIDNELFTLKENCLAVIPPFCYHKTEGGAYVRTNLSFHQHILGERELSFLNDLVKARVVVVDDRYLDIITRLLAEADGVRGSGVSSELKRERTAQLIRTILMFLSMQNNRPVPPDSSGKKKPKDRKNTTSEMLRVAQYINKNYTHKITLDDICKKFLISKTALNVKFKEVMQCTVVEYILSVRLKRAVYLLHHTRRSVEEISQNCGFSSANYFGLMFKKKMGCSPSTFHQRHGRKKRKRKTEETPKQN